ncbi:MAG: hypothetical protein O3A14_02720 [Cyanobacteria bacterium]|nr:hypothetical protein [Cyanobacteriota bacterium]
MRHPYSHHWPLRIATKVLKYFLLGLAGCTLTYVIAWGFNLALLSTLMVTVLEQVLGRALVLVICLGAIAVITESLST